MSAPSARMPWTRTRSARRIGPICARSARGTRHVHDRSEPAGRLCPGARRDHGSRRGLARARRRSACGSRGAARGRRAGRRRDRLCHARTLQPHGTHAALRRRADRGRVFAGWCAVRRSTPIRKWRARASGGCETPALPSRSARWPSRRAHSTPVSSRASSAAPADPPETRHEPRCAHGARGGWSALDQRRVIAGGRAALARTKLRGS